MVKKRYRLPGALPFLQLACLQALISQLASAVFAPDQFPREVQERLLIVVVALRRYLMVLQVLLPEIVHAFSMCISALLHLPKLLPLQE